jgi:hypothetical protein
MARLPFDVERLLSMAGIYFQLEQATQQLEEAISRDMPDAPADMAFAVVDDWQARFQDLLTMEIPDWPCLAAFRSIVDFNLEPSQSPEFEGVDFKQTKDCVPENLSTRDELRKAYGEYFAGRDLYAGKFTVVDPVASDLRKRIDDCRATVGGQAGNILWLLANINANPRGYVPYLAERLKGISELLRIPFLSVESSGSEWKPLQAHMPGVVSTSSATREQAPSGASFAIAQKGKRMILQLEGFRVVVAGAPVPLPFDTVEYRLDSGSPDYSRPSAAEVLGSVRREPTDAVWPQLPFFSRVFLRDRTLVIEILGDERLRAAVRSKSGGVEAQLAVLGGLNAVFFDKWLSRAPGLRLRLATLVERQLRILRSSGIRIGAELSGKPDRDYYEMLKRLCGEGTVVALGVNGEDELPEITNFTERGACGQIEKKQPVSYDSYLDPEEIPAEIRGAIDQKKASGFLFITYLRARKLARALGVRTLYVHTNTVDLILRRHGDPGALYQAQRAAFLGKGLVLAALMKRSYPEPDPNSPDYWMNKLPGIPFAVNPEAMALLWDFARHFDRYAFSGSWESLLTTGICINPDDTDYSVAVVPVLWPSLGDAKNLPQELNTTGGGDMTLGSFFYIAGP